MPLAVFSRPETSEQARAMPNLPHNFVRCVDCGHIYNADFDSAAVSASNKPKPRVRRGPNWSKHLHTVKETIQQSLPPSPTVIDIGFGDGLFRSLAADCEGGRFIQFDPRADIEEDDGLIRTEKTRFEPTEHLPQFKPNLILCRHASEHLRNPSAFIQTLGFAASWLGIRTTLFIEAPCIDNVFARGRTVDFFYEHNSHFTTKSLGKMLARGAAKVKLITTSHRGEVVFAIAEFNPRAEQVANAHEALRFRADAGSFQRRLRDQFDLLHRSGKSVAIWGGAGRAAAFINQYGLDAERFPLVVDSDPAKIGGHVPGAGQTIRSQDVLQDQPVDVILIAAQWRAGDIMSEIGQNAIPHQLVLIEHHGKLVDYFDPAHPYAGDRREESPTPVDQPSSIPKAPTRTGLSLVPRSSNPNL